MVVRSVAPFLLYDFYRRFVRLGSNYLAAARWQWLATGWPALVAVRSLLISQQQLDVKSYFSVAFLCARPLQLFEVRVVGLGDQKRAGNR